MVDSQSASLFTGDIKDFSSTEDENFACSPNKAYVPLRETF